MPKFLCYTVETVKQGCRYVVEAKDAAEAEAKMRRYLDPDTGEDERSETDIEPDIYYDGEGEAIAEKYDPSIGPEEIT
jgi:hypothetical protein